MTEKQEQNFNSTKEWLLAQVEQWLVDNPGIKPETFGHYAIGDTTLVERLRRGGDVTTRKLDRIIKALKIPAERLQDGKKRKRKISQI